MFSVKKTFVVLAAVSLVSGALLAGALVGYSKASSSVSSAYDVKHRSYLLADEFRQSSDDLTRLARTYVITSDPIYKQQYNDIIAIRNGRRRAHATTTGFIGISWLRVKSSLARSTGPSRFWTS